MREKHKLEINNLAFRHLYDLLEPFFDFKLECNFYQWIRCDPMRDLVPFVQFKKCEKLPWRSVIFTPATLLKVTFFFGCFSRFWIVQMLPNHATHLRYFEHFRAISRRSVRGKCSLDIHRRTQNPCTFSRWLFLRTLHHVFVFQYKKVSMTIEDRKCIPRYWTFAKKIIISKVHLLS